MLVLQLSDLHVEEPGVLAYGVADTAAMFHAAIRHIKSLRKQPDLVVITGDLSSDAKPQGYRIVRDGIRQLDMPVYVLPGNHDKRETLQHYLGPWCPADPSLTPELCYSVDNREIRVVCLDTTAPDSHSGHASAGLAAWLDTTLATAPDTPTLLFMHHPPIFVGMKYMDEPFEGLQGLGVVVRKYPQVRVCCGHMHRSFVGQWEGRLLVCCPAVSMQMEVDLGERGGDTFFMETPGYALHTLQQGNFLTFFGQIPGQATFSGPHPFLGLNLGTEE